MPSGKKYSAIIVVLSNINFLSIDNVGLVGIRGTISPVGDSRDTDILSDGLTQIFIEKL